MYILGLSCFYHDAAACLIRDGEIVGAAQEERFTRRKHDANFPENAVMYCLKEAGISISDISYVVFYEKPFLKFERIIMTHLGNWPRGFLSFHEMLDSWLGQKLRIPSVIHRKLGYKGDILFVKHHESHAASAFFCSPFQEAAVVTVDAVGEWTTTAIGTGKGSSIRLIKQICFPHSLGLLYSAFTYFLGFEVNDGEYKVMGLAPYGEPRYVSAIKKDMIEIFADGSFKMNPRYFAYEYGRTMIRTHDFERLFGIKKRDAKEAISQQHKDLAASIQKILEEILILICGHASQLTGSRNLCLSGGVALNCTVNSRILKSGIFDDVFVFPAAGDAGGAVGAALFAWHEILGHERKERPLHDIFWGPEFGNKEIKDYLDRAGIGYEELPDDVLIRKAARLIADQKIVGWFQGRMEFGPRALGNRSILADPRDKSNWGRINSRIKRREDFRPLAPAILEERMADFFDIPKSSPFMLFVCDNKTGQIPAVTHIDNTSRIQTVSKEVNPLFYALISEFDKLAGVPVLINTSLNVAGMPIACTPQNAFQCFLEAKLDVLVMGNFMVHKKGGWTDEDANG